MFCRYRTRYRNIENIDAGSEKATICAPVKAGLRNRVRSSIGSARVALDGHERDEQQHRGGQQPDDERAPPALVVAPDQGEDEAEECAAEGDQPGPVDAGGRVAL